MTEEQNIISASQLAISTKALLCSAEHFNKLLDPFLFLWTVPRREFMLLKLKPSRQIECSVNKSYVRNLSNLTWADQFVVMWEDVIVIGVTETIVSYSL